MVTVMSRPDSDSDQVGRIRRTWRSRWAWWAALGLVIAAIVVTVALAVSGGETTTTAATAPRPAFMPQPSDHDMSVPTEAPAIRWTYIDGVEIPDGGMRYGPTFRNPAQQLDSGWAHTPRGALLAAISISGRHLVGNWRPTAEQQTTGAGKRPYILLRERVDGSPPVGGFCSTAGFRYVSWSVDAAVIEVASVCPSADIQSTVLTVVWENGDWRLQLMPDGSESPHAGPISSLNGFAPFYSEGPS